MTSDQKEQSFPEPEAPELHGVLYPLNNEIRFALELDELAKQSVMESLGADNPAVIKSSLFELIATGIMQNQVKRSIPKRAEIILDL